MKLVLNTQYREFIVEIFEKRPRLYFADGFINGNCEIETSGDTISDALESAKAQIDEWHRVK